MLFSTRNNSFNSINEDNGSISMMSLYDKLRCRSVLENTWMLSIDSNPVKGLKEYHRNDNEDDDDTLNTIEQINLVYANFTRWINVYSTTSWIES